MIYFNDETSQLRSISYCSSGRNCCSHAIRFSVFDNARKYATFIVAVGEKVRNIQSLGKLWFPFTNKFFCYATNSGLSSRQVTSPKLVTRGSQIAVWRYFWTFDSECPLEADSKPSTSFKASRYEKITVPLKADFTLGGSRNSQDFLASLCGPSNLVLFC